MEEIKDTFDPDTRRRVREFWIKDYLRSNSSSALQEPLVQRAVLSRLARRLHKKILRVTDPEQVHQLVYETLVDVSERQTEASARKLALKYTEDHRKKSQDAIKKRRKIKEDLKKARAKIADLSAVIMSVGGYFRSLEDVSGVSDESSPNELKNKATNAPSVVMDLLATIDKILDEK